MSVSDLIKDEILGWENVVGVVPESKAPVLLHLRFREAEPKDQQLADLLATLLVNYVVPLKKRKRAVAESSASATGGGTQAIIALQREATRILIKYNEKNPSRYGEVGELISYAVAIKHLGAAQVASKMALKTSSEMPVYGSDGLHLKVNDDGSATFFLLESKIVPKAGTAISDFCASVSELRGSRDRRVNEIRIVTDLSNLDALEGTAREEALSYFNEYDTSGKTLARRERFVGTLLYNEHAYSLVGPVDDSKPVNHHEVDFLAKYSRKEKSHGKTLRDNAATYSLPLDECVVFILAVPDVLALKKRFAEVQSDHIRI